MATGQIDLNNSVEDLSEIAACIPKLWNTLSAYVNEATKLEAEPEEQLSFQNKLRLISPKSSIPSYSVEAERCFSAAALFATKLLSRMAENLMSALQILKMFIVNKEKLQ